MEYQELLREMIGECRSDAERFLSGSRESYMYRMVSDEKYGSTDGNYKNRTRLCYGLLYGGCAPEEIEGAVRELFLTEVISRENEAFQGIGINIELLTVMLMRYASPDDEELFERAKNANFDCFCGYDRERIAASHKELEDFTLDDCIDAAGKMGRTDYAGRFVDIFREQPLGLEELYILRSYAKYDTLRMSDRETAVTGIYEHYMSEPPEDSYRLLIAVEEYVLLLADKGGADMAADVFMEHRDIFSTHPRTAYEVGSRLIRDGIAKKAEVWEIILPMIKAEFRNIAPVNYAPLADSAEIIGDMKLAKKLRKTGEKKLSAIKRSSER